MSTTGLLPRIAGVLGVAMCMMAFTAFGQSNPEVDHEIWFFAFGYFKINDRATFNQNLAYEQSFETQHPKKFFLKSQFNYSLSSVLSLHGGLSFYFHDNGKLQNNQEVRPWQGVKLRWPSFWRLDFTHYVRLEERFEYLPGDTPWSNHVRLRYKLGTILPINKASFTEKTFYLALAYQYVANPFDELAHKHTDFQRYEAGPGFKFNKKSRLEALLIYAEDIDPILDKFTLSTLAVQMKYYHYFNF